MKYIIHRGITSKKNSDNSYMAIKRALFDKESIGVEFDIRLTKDKKIVLSHDSVLGINYIENMNYKDIIKHKYLTTLDKILDIDTDKYGCTVRFDDTEETWIECDQLSKE